MRGLRGLPRHVLFTFEDLGPFGDKEQRTLFFNDLLPRRGVPNKKRRKK